MTVTIRRLDQPREPRWLDLGLGVRVRVRPLDSAMFAAASRMARARIEADRPEWAAARLDGMDEGLWTAGLTTALAKLAILEWTGVEDAGTTAAVTADAVRRLFDEEWVLAQAFHQDYVLAGEQLAAEGNGSAPVPDGSSAAGPTTAGTAKRHRARTAPAGTSPQP